MTRPVRWFRCPAHGCDWKLNANYYEQYQLRESLRKHITKTHPRLTNWVGLKIKVRNFR